MSHFHISQTLDGEEMQLGIDRHMECLANAALGLVDGLPRLGWTCEIANFYAETATLWFSYESDSEDHILRIAITPCACSVGEIYLVGNETNSREVAPLN